MSDKCKLALRYHGGKWMLAPWVISHFPEHRVYVEPFGGAASVLIRKERSYAEIYGDLNDEVVSFFEVLRDRPRYLETVVRLTPFAEAELKRAYEPCDDALESARRVVVRSFQGHGSDSIGRVSGFRSDSNRSGSTPSRDWARWPDRIAAIAERLKGVTIMKRDALEVMRKFDRPDALHYVDPPYLNVTRKSVGAYSCEFSEESQHRALAECLSSLSGMVVLSGYPSDLYGVLFAGWTQVSRKAFADGAAPRTECLWLNPAAAAALEKEQERPDILCTASPTITTPQIGEGS